MNHRINEPEPNGTHIWLRYATQFSVGERTYTVEMGVPMPVGASAEQREKLLREAEMGMGQLTQVVEKRVAQMLRQPPVAQVPSSTAVTGSGTAAKAASTLPPRPPQRPVPTSSVQSAATPSPLTIETPAHVINPRGRGETEEHRLAAPRATTGNTTTMPIMPRPSVGSEANIPLPDFLTAIRENLNLTPKQAMGMLKVKSLNGINLREALDNLQAMVDGGFSDIDQLKAAHPELQNAANRIAPAARDAQPPEPEPEAEIVKTPSRPLQQHQEPENNNEAQSHQRAESRSTQVREQPVVLSRFDEEIGPDEDEQSENDELLDLDEIEEEEEDGLSASDRLRAGEILDELRAIRGSHNVSTERLKVLNRLVLQQIEAAQLRDLLQGVWGVTTPAKLKVEQAEQIINWAKQDDFVSEVETVLQLLGEDNYARGNR